MGTQGVGPVSEPDLGMLSTQLYLAVQNQLWASLAAEGFTDLRPRHGGVLAYLDADGTRASELAHRSGQHKQIVGTVIDELETLGYVHRTPDPTDRRAKLVYPTARGLAEIRTARQIIAGIERDHARAVGPDRYRQFMATLAELVERYADETDPAPPAPADSHDVQPEQPEQGEPP